MAQVTSVTVMYEAMRKPAGDYTNDRAKIEWTIHIEDGEKAGDITSKSLDQLKRTVMEKLSG